MNLCVYVAALIVAISLLVYLSNTFLERGQTNVVVVVVVFRCDKNRIKNCITSERFNLLSISVPLI